MGGCGTSFAQSPTPQSPVRVRGSITAVDGNVLSVKSRDGKELKLHLAPDAGVSTARAVKLSGGNEITMKYQSESQRIFVPEGTPVVTSVPGSRADLKPGEYVFAVAQQQAEGRLTAPRITVSKNGIRPPQ